MRAGIVPISETVSEEVESIAERRAARKLQVAPVILVDSREQHVLPIHAFPVEVAGLRTGDYSIKGFESRFCVERKSLSDLIGSLTQGRERFFGEIDRMVHYQVAILLIEGDRSQVEAHGYRSQATPQSILASVDAITVRTPVKVEWATDAETAARRFESFVRLFARGVEKDYRALIGNGANRQSQPATYNPISEGVTSCLNL